MGKMEDNTSTGILDEVEVRLSKYWEDCLLVPQVSVFVLKVRPCPHHEGIQGE